MLPGPAETRRLLGEPMNVSGVNQLYAEPTAERRREEDLDQAVLSALWHSTPGSDETVLRFGKRMADAGACDTEFRRTVIGYLHVPELKGAERLQRWRAAKIHRRDYKHWSAKLLDTRRGLSDW